MFWVPYYGFWNYGEIGNMKALIIDDHPVFISALERILRDFRDGISVHTASSIEAALECIEFNQDFQLILLDLSLPGLDGFSFLRVLKQRSLHIPVVVVSSRDDPQVMHDCIEAGAVGFIPKAYSVVEIQEAIARIFSGEIYLPEGMHQVPDASESLPKISSELPIMCQQLGIGNKTYKVLCCLAEGYTNKEIGQHLHISVHTVKAHLAQLFQSLHTNNRTDTLMAAIRLGVIGRNQ